ncbi:nickel-dependent hydrogenase large subunit [Methyloterricola oryzae]|uniref:nickel-dependent hydrogenase large subunit n=1 Tax=Methyloterricola oryzae TaxID=1495050 RepID=UPI00069CABB7|nr:nickel-dependent hydrogenase large subunit [Methyloterricola oryzae]
MAYSEAEHSRAASLVRGIGVRCVVKHGVITQVEIEPRRPPPVDRLLIGQPCEAVLPMLGVVFSVCGHAHRLAASQALAAVLDAPMADDELRRLVFLRDLESVREHSLNLLQSVPTKTNEHALAREIIASVQALAAGAAQGAPDTSREAAVATLHAALQVLFGRFWRLTDASMDAVLDWAQASDAPVARLLAACLRPGWAEFGAHASPALPPLSAAKLDQSWLSSDPGAFAATPSWDGIPCETSCYSRQSGHPLIAEAARRYGPGLLARNLARMLETVLLAKGLAAPAPLRHPICGVEQVAGNGFAQVEASRGRLMHWVGQEWGRVSAYRILAPTEWNFHPRGLVYQGLMGAKAGDPMELEQKIRGFLQTVDPCVPFELNVLA